MRISDWSSDVCSSDLIGINDLSKSKDGDSKELRGVAKIEHDRNEILLRKYAAYARTVMNSEKIGISADKQSRDRKSVVEGKSVSVGVDLGGRRFIKKKNKKTYKGLRRRKEKQK